MRRADTGERRIIRFYAAGRGYLQDGYLAARWFYAMPKTATQSSIRRGLLNLLYGLQEWRGLPANPTR